MYIYIVIIKEAVAVLMVSFDRCCEAALIPTFLYMEPGIFAVLWVKAFFPEDFFFTKENNLSEK